MATYSKLALSPGGTEGNGTPILLGSTATAIHRGSTTTTTYDEVWLYAHNYDTVDRKLTIQWGGTADKDLIETILFADSGLVLVAPGLILKGAATALNIQGFADTATCISVSGYVNRITA